MSNTFESLRTKWCTEYANIYKKTNNLSNKNFQSVKKTDEYIIERETYVTDKFVTYYKSKENQRRKDIIQHIDENISEKKQNQFVNYVISDLENVLENQMLQYEGTKIIMENIMDYEKEMIEVPFVFIKNVSLKKGKKKLFDYAEECFKNYLNQHINNLLNGTTYYLDKSGKKHYVSKKHQDELMKNFEKNLIKRITDEWLITTLEKNPNYFNFRNEYKRTEKVLKEIPENFIDLYPHARMLHRHFILHIGGTNSGKTYQSLERLKEVKTGVYLAPLRLLALEVQEKMLESNVMCSLSTGEEEDIVQNATHMSSTVEKLNIEKNYDVCVIDECQMLQDRDRGWAWTRAILGVCANEIHVCMSPDAEKIVIKLIEECGDTYEIVKHERNTELIFEDEPFHYPNDVRDHDCLIVFSRKNVLSVASELESRGLKVSILYGALPYPVRKSELKKFMNGETNILVATDCVGLGVNVCIKRILYLQTSKYDGFENRMLNISEVKQISGRAGRYGIFDVGYVNAIADRKYIKKLLNSDYKDIELAKINFPETLLNLDEKLSDTLITWSKITDTGLFVKTDIERDLMLCRYLEQYPLEKSQILSLINMPFDERNDEILNLWKRLVKKYVKNTLNLKEEIKLMPLTDNLEALELAHKKFDLVFSFMKALQIQNEEIFEIVKNSKLKISMKIIELLKKEKTNFKRCSRCGKKLSWNYPYGICQNCYNRSLKYYDSDDRFNDESFW